MSRKIEQANAGKLPDPEIEIPEGDVVAIGGSKDDILFAARPDFKKQIVGSESTAICDIIVNQCMIGLSDGELTEGTFDMRAFALEMVRELAPRDGVERMLAVQMVTTHIAMVRTGRLLATATMLRQTEAYDRLFNKLARTYTAQMETLRKHRNGGKQVVQVQHVNVSEGGQAIVGNVKVGGRGSNEK